MKSKNIVGIMAVLIVLATSFGVYAYSSGNNYQHGAEPPTAGITSPDHMDQLPSGQSDINRSPAAPDTKGLYMPTCEVDSSLMDRSRSQTPTADDQPGKDVQVGTFSCRA